VIRGKYMLDTNTVSHLVKQHPEVVRHVIDVPMDSLCVSAITAGEVHYGLAKRPEAVRLRVAVTELMRRVDVLPWDSSAAEHYGIVRADLERAGRPLGSLDALIAAHALSVGAVLVTTDRAFNHVAHLRIENWAVGQP
jgi:tRNA(fMet)-specific endonuclease VapC